MFGIHHLIVIPADAWNHGGGAGARGVPAFKCVATMDPGARRDDEGAGRFIATAPVPLTATGSAPTA